MSNDKLPPERGQDKKSPPIPPRRTSVGIVLATRRQRDGKGKSSATPPPPSPSLIWDAMSNDRDELQQSIQALVIGGFAGAGELESEFKSLSRIGDEKPDEALARFRTLRGQVANAGVWHAAAVQRTNVENGIVQLESLTKPIAITLRTEFGRVEQTAAHDAKLAVTSLESLEKRVKAALDWEAVAVRVPTVDNSITNLTNANHASANDHRNSLNNILQLADTDPAKAVAQFKSLERRVGQDVARSSPEALEHLQRSNKIFGEIQRIEAKLKKGGFGTPLPDEVKAELETLAAEEPKRQGAMGRDDYVAALAALGELERVLPVIQQYEFGRANAITKNLTRNFPDKKDQRAELMSHMTKNPQILFQLAGTEEGRTILDGLVNDLGTSIKSEKDKAFVAAAIKGRFGLSVLEGDLTTKALPQLYKLLNAVPLSHTRGNDSLKKVRRNKGSDEPSYYRDSENIMVLNLNRTGEMTSGAFDADSDSTEKTTTGDVNYFNHTTLHEIGHAVDKDKNYMGTHGKLANHGGWASHSIGEIADVVGNDQKFGFYAKWDEALGRPFLKEYLVRALQGKVANLKTALTTDDTALLTDAGMIAAIALKPDLIKEKPTDQSHPDESQREKQTEKYNKKVKTQIKKMVAKSKSKDKAFQDILKQAIERLFADQKVTPDKAVADALAANRVAVAPQGNATTVDWDSLMTDLTVKWCGAVRMQSGTSGLWDKGATGAKLALSDGRVYFESYAGDWSSYLATARKSGVSSYQFRSPVEWFAEAYAARLQDKLSDAHPVSRWLDAEKQSG